MQSLDTAFYNFPHLKLKKILIAVFFLLFVNGLFAKETPPENGRTTSALNQDEFHKGKIHSHPRIMANSEDFKRIKRLYKNKSNEYLTHWIDNRLAKANELLDEEFDNPKSNYYIGYYLYDGVRTNAGARMLNAIEKFSFAYKMTEDPVYAQKVWYLLKRAGASEIESTPSVALFPGWYPKFFLGLSAMATAYAIGYDWCYDFFSEEQKKYIEHSILEYGLKPASEIFTKDSESFEMRGNTNRNVVKNSGIILAALSIADKYPDVTAKLIRKGIDNIQYMMPEFAPDGAWLESVSYWDYTISYFIPLVSSLEISFGENYGLMDYNGLKRTGEFPMQATGPLGANNFHDGSTSKVFASSPAIFWLAKYFRNPDLTAAKLDFMVQNNLDAEMCDILWYDTTVASPKIKLNRDAYFGGVEFVSMRKEWDNPETTWVSFHGGLGEGSHTHMDGGAFVFDALGVRWAGDLHSEDYNVGGYRSYTESKRTYYRVRTEGHNTLVINPDKSVGQDLDSYMKVIKFVPRENNPYSVLDMTSGYKKAVYRAVRGYMLADNRNSLIIRDELELKDSLSEIYWFMHTQAEAKVTGQNKVMLTKDGKSMELEFVTNAKEAQISIVPAKPLPSSPEPYAGKQSDNSDFRKVQIQLIGAGKVDLTVKLKPTGTKYQSVSDVPIYKWNIYTFK